MRRVFTIGFGVVIAGSVAVWLVGILAGVVVPLFGGIRAETLGEIGFSAGMIGEVFAYGFGWLRKRLTRQEAERIRGFPGAKRYEDKKPVA